MRVIDFSTALQEEKVKVCAEIQKILIETRPDSEYLIRQDSPESSLRFYKKLINDFQGMCLFTDGAILIYKIVDLVHPSDKLGEFLRVKNLPHNPSGNCIFIDFFVAKINEKNATELRSVIFDKRIEYYLFSRRGDIHIASKEEVAARSEKLSSLLLG